MIKNIIKIKISATKIALTSLAIFISSTGLALAQVPGQTRTLRDVAVLVVSYFRIAIYLVMALAVLLFVWNVFKYFFMPDKDKVEAGKYVMYSIIGFVVIFTFWGLVQLLINTTGLNNSAGTIRTNNVNLPYGSSVIPVR